MPEVELKISSKNLTKKALREIQKDLDATAKKLVKAAEESEKFGKKGESAFAKLRRSVKAIQPDFQKLAIGAGAISAGLTFLTKSFIGAAVATQKMKAGLLAVSSSAKEAEIQFKRLEEVAKLPGLGLPEAVQGSIRLQAAGLSAKEATRSLAAFGNAVAEVSGGRAALSLVVHQLAQMANKTKILAEDMDTIKDQAPSVTKAMKAAFGTANLEDIRKLNISTKDFIRTLVSELEKLPRVSGGVANSFENLRDSIEKIKSDFGTILLPTVVKITDALSKLAERVNNLSDTQKSMIVWGTVVAAGITGLVAAMAGLSIAIPHVISAVKALGTAVTFLAAHPIIALAAAITAVLVVAFVLWQKEAKKTERAMNDLSKAIQSTNKEAILLRMAPAKKELADLEKQITKTRIAQFRANEELKKSRRQFSGLQGFDSIFSPLTVNEQELKRVDEKLAKQLELATNLKKQIKAGQDILDRKPTEAGKPPPPPPGTPDTKEADKVFQAWADMERSRIALISDSYKREREEAILSNKIIIHNIQEQLKEKKIQTERASHLNQQLSLEKQKLEQELADIDKRFAQERNERISKDILTERQFYEMSVQAAQDVALRKKEITEQLSAAELELSIRMAEAKVENAERTEKMITEGARKAALEKQKFEESVNLTKEIIAQAEIAIEVANYNRRLELNKNATEQLLAEYETRRQAFVESLEGIKKAEADAQQETMRFALSIGQIFSELPFKMAEAFTQGQGAIKQVFKGFFVSLGNFVQQEIQKILAQKIAAQLAGSALIGGGITGLLPVAGIAFAASKLFGFDNPVHDRLAQISGGNTAMLMGASFDDPYNDMKARLGGTYTASRDLGRRSAEDMLANFQAGFIQKSQSLGNNGAEGQRSADVPKFQLIIDGRPLHAVLKRIDDSVASRDGSY